MGEAGLVFLLYPNDDDDDDARIEGVTLGDAVTPQLIVGELGSTIGWLFSLFYSWIYQTTFASYTIPN